MKIAVVTLSYNCADFIQRCIDSVDIQTYPAKYSIIVDDASTDENHTDIVMKSFVQDKDYFHDVIVNIQNLGPVKNLRNAIKSIGKQLDDDDVIFLLDGDDYLPHADVLSRMAEIYADPDIWITWGNYTSDPFNPLCPAAGAYPDAIIDNNLYRKYACLFNHPITFRKFLWDALDEDDFHLANGEHIKEPYDEAIFWPMIEMAGRHGKFIDETLYVYNSENPISCIYTNQDGMERTGKELVARKPKDLLVR